MCSKHSALGGRILGISPRLVVYDYPSAGSRYLLKCLIFLAPFWCKTNYLDDKDDMFICHERGTKKKSESPTGIEPMTS